MTEAHNDLTRSLLSVIFIVALIGSCLWILRPFLGATVWATTIVVATWPLMITLQNRLWHKRSLAVAVMTIVLLCVLVVPLSMAIGTIISNTDEIIVWVKAFETFKIPPHPAWVAKLPFIGDKVVAVWEKTAREGIQEIAATIGPYAGDLIKWFVAQVGGFGKLLVEFLLTVLIAAILYANGEELPIVFYVLGVVWQGCTVKMRSGLPVRPCAACRWALLLRPWPSRCWEVWAC